MYILWTDLALWLVVMMGITSILLIRTNTVIWAKWQLLLHSRLQQIVIVILLIYLSIAVLDSIHWKNHGEIYSILDWLCSRLIDTQEHTFSPPSASHILGTNKVGVDVLYSCLKSIRTGVLLGGLTIVFMLPAGVLLGTIAGYFGGWLDDLIQFFYTVISSVPSVLLISAAMLSLQIWMDRYADSFATSIERVDMRLILLCFVLGVTNWTSLCRVLRAQCLHLREQNYISAAKVLGIPNWAIIVNHLIPNLLSIILISVALDFSALVLAEAVLSYVGVGVDPMAFSWGNMINSARLELSRDPIVWWSLFGAFSFMLTLVLAANLFADGLREVFDPKGQICSI